MHKLLLGLITVFFISANLLLSSDVLAQESEVFTPYQCFSGNPCTTESTTRNCEPPSAFCATSNLCRKFTGTECCINLGFSSCRVIPDRWICINPGGGGDSFFDGFQCFNAPTPTPTPPPPTPAACTSFLACGTCQPSDSCGWCFNSNQCKHGTSNGSDDGLCTGSNWGFFSCAAPPTPTPTPDPCSGFSVCGGLSTTCTRQSSCGWCKSTNTCQTGNVSGSTAGASCSGSNWAWTQDQCPATSCNLPPACGPETCISNAPSCSTSSCPSGQFFCSSGTTGLCCISPTPTPTLPPGVTPTPTPTPVPGRRVTIQGRHVDVLGNALTVNIGQGVQLSNGGVNFNLGAWDFSRIASGTYTVTANIPAGFSVSNSVCTGCTIHITYSPGNVVTVLLPNNNDFADIFFKYTPGPTPTPTPSGCTIDSQCPGCQICTNNACVDGSSRRCPVNQTCSGTSCVNLPPALPTPPLPPPFGQIRICDILIPASSTCFVCGYVYEDTNGNQVRDPGEVGRPNASVLHSSATTASECANFTANSRPPSNPQLTNINGRYEYIFFASQFPIFNACHKAEVTVPAGFIPTNGSGNYVYGSSCFPIQLDLGIARPQAISGNIFVDSNKNKIKDNNETNYTELVNVSFLGSIVNFTGNFRGTYSINDLPPGQYTLTFSGLPTGSIFTYPQTSLTVSLGQNCSVPVTSEGRCSSGNIINLNAGVTNTASSWFQSQGADMRWDSGFTNIMPANKFASILGTGGMPGIIFSGTTTPSFGAGSASQFNWKVSGNSADTRDVFTDTHNLIPTSYIFLLETVDGSAIAKKGVRDLCSNGNSFNCILNPALVHGVYFIDNNLTLTGSGYTFPANQNYVILINGNLNINEKIHIPIGSTVIFSAKEDITVNRTVGETASSASQTIEGLYSADRDFVADGANNCSLSSDLRLNVGGSVIANAGRGNGTFANNRDLCAGNSSFPSVSFIERPDFMLNYPSLAGYNPRAWRDVAP